MSKRLMTAAMFATVFVSVAMAGETQEFRLEEARTIYPCYRTWEFEVEEPGLYAIDVVPPSGRQPVRPGIRLWLDGVQIGFVRDATDYSVKVGDKGCFRRIRRLERGRHSLDLYLKLGAYEFEDSMEQAMGKVGIKFEAKRLENGEVGFWMPDDCMARVSGEPLVVCGCAAENGSRREFTMEVLRASATPREVIWSKALAVDTKPVRFEYPCDKEGAFKYVVRDDKGEVVEGPWDFVVTDVGERGTGNVSKYGTGEPILVDRVDCTEGAGGEHIFRESGKSEIVETPDGAYRQTGPHGCRDIFYDKSDKDGNWQRIPKNKNGAAWRRDFDWFGYTLHVEHPGKTHLLACKIPNDVRRLTHVFAFDRRTGRNNGWGLDTGDAPAAGPWSELRIPVWPNTNVIDVMVVNTDGVRNSHVPHPNRRGAAAELSLVEYPDGLPALEAPGCGWDRTREFGWDGEQVDLGPNERTMPRLSDDAAAALWSKEATTKGNYRYGPAHSWADMAATWERTFELEAWRGGTTIAFPVYSYGMVSFQGLAQKIVPPANDRYAVNRVGATCGDPFDRDTFALMLQRAEKHGVKLVADFMVQRTYGHVVEAWARRYGMEDATNGIYLSVSADGRPYKSAPCVYAGMPNPAHPAARAAQIEFCREFGRRYGRYASFGGIQHRFWKGWPGSFEPWFHSADTGFDDFTVGEFSKATGIVFAPVGTDESAFADRKNRIREKYGREWNDWRTQVCLSLHGEMLAALREGAPHARFYVLDPQQGAFRSGTGLDCDVFAGRRDFGFDVAQLTVDGPGVEINHLDPATFGHFFPNLDQKSVPLGKRIVPGSLCCNRSYRCSPYHLEPAALALAENRLDSLWMGGQWCLPPADETLREFVRVYRAIPDRNDWTRAGFGHKEHKGNGFDPVAVWWAKDGDDVLFWAVNRTDANRRVVLHFDKETAALIDCVTVNPVNPVKNNSASSATLREIALSPFMPGVFRAKGAGSLLGFEVPVDPEEAAQIEKDYAFLSSFGARPGCTTAAEVSLGTGETYCPGAKALGKRDERWTWRELFAPMTAAHDAGDLFELRSILADFRANHRWWFEAFGWPEDFCVVRNVGRKTLAGFLDFQRRVRPEEVYLRDTNGVETAILPQAKSEFVCVPKGVAMEVVRHGSIGGCHQLELTALFGGGYGDIRVENSDGELLGVISGGRPCRSERKERLETRILSVPIPGPDKDTCVRLTGMGEKGLAILRIGFKSLPPKPVREWNVIGPFDAGRCDRSHDGRAVITNSFAPEMGVDLAATYAGIDGKALKWKKVVLGEGERLLDVKALAPCDTTSEIGVAYLHAVVDSPRRRKTAMYWMNDYFGTIWLNGEAVVPEMKGPILGYEGKTVRLKEGRNDILVKTSAGSAGAWVFGLAFDDDDIGPDANLRLSSCSKAKMAALDKPLFGPPCERVAAFVREARAAYAKPTFANGEGSVIHKYSREDPFGHDPCEDVPAPVPFDDALPRFYAIPGLRNVRDIGGWNGLVPGRVFRGSQLRRTDGPDGICQGTRDGLLKTLGIRTELDLRGVAEWGVINYDTSGLADITKAGIAAVHVPFPSYLALFAPTNAPIIADAVRLFADPSAYPIYVHCAGGADRTGALVLILQSLCGASEADIDVDYELTSFAVVFGLRHRDETERLAWKSMKDAFRAAAPDAPDLASAVEHYCRSFLGLSASEIAAIRKHLCGRDGGGSLGHKYARCLRSHYSHFWKIEKGLTGGNVNEKHYDGIGRTCRHGGSRCGFRRSAENELAGNGQPVRIASRRNAYWADAVAQC